MSRKEVKYDGFLTLSYYYNGKRSQIKQILTNRTNIDKKDKWMVPERLPI